MKQTLLYSFASFLMNFALCADITNASHRTKKGSSTRMGNSTYGALIYENYSPRPETIEGLIVTQVFEASTAAITNPQTPDSKQTLPVWTPINVKTNNQEFLILYNHFTGAYWGPGGGDEAFADKYYMKAYSAEEAAQRCAELEPAGKWRLPDTLELTALFNHQISKIWKSLDTDHSKFSMIAQNQGDKEFVKFTPDATLNDGKKADSIETFNDKNKEHTQKLFKFKCIMSSK